ncbi:hypothetical protein ACFWX5_14460 [[Kitasatospora] papulosa]|uniref:hypothetical protein n=1 Tax=[Kitasatospora] papulosa TaxID=1464011 RepID=UPI00369521FC
MNSASESNSYPIPSDRTTPDRQWEIFLVAAHLSGPDLKVISVSRLAAEVQLRNDTVGAVAGFLQAVGLLQGARGNYALTSAGWAIAEMHKQDETQARLLLQAQFLEHWPTASTLECLHDAPVEQKMLGRRLHKDLPGKSRRGLYLIEWLVRALIVQRDSSMRISASAALVASGQRSGAASKPQRTVEPGTVMGMTREELRSLPPRKYIAVLDQLAALVSLDPA